MELSVKEVETIRNDKLGPKLVEAFKKRQFDAWYFSNREDAMKQLEALIPQDHVVSWGGSLTMETLGVQKLMREKRAVIDRDTAKNPDERIELMRKAMTCDTYLTGVNAISETGELVQMDGIGNRVAATIFGPKQVIVIVGMNKAVKTLDDALHRTRTIAAPKNVQRFSAKKTPCSATGSCGDCHTAECVCAYFSVIRVSAPPGRIKVILINETLGL